MSFALDPPVHYCPDCDCYPCHCPEYDCEDCCDTGMAHDPIRNGSEVDFVRCPACQEE